MSEPEQENGSLNEAHRNSQFPMVDVSLHSELLLKVRSSCPWYCHFWVSDYLRFGYQMLYVCFVCRREGRA